MRLLLDLLELFGDEYITQHITTELHKQSLERVYRTYVTDALMAISSQNQKMKKRYADIVKEMFEKPKKEESAREIKNRFLTGLNKLMGKGEET